LSSTAHTAEIPLPEWAALEVLNLIREHHFAGGGGQPGAYNGTKGKFNMDYAHWLRWKAVAEALRQNRLTELPQGRRGRRRKDDPPGRTAILEQAAGRIADANRWPGSVTSRQLGASYELVKASRQAGERRFDFSSPLATLNSSSTTSVF
jgi:hypothetical protein